MGSAEAPIPRSRLGALADALDLFVMPVALYDADGTAVAANNAAAEAGGYTAAELAGRHFGDLALPSAREAARAHFDRCIETAEPVEFETIFVKASGGQSAVRLRLLPLAEARQVIAVLLVAYVAKEDHLIAQQLGSAPALTRRQHEILVLLASAHSTTEIAERLGLATETVRNHVRALLKELNAHSRLEAVVIAERLGMLPPTPFRAAGG
jgi:PAS domain S-box-containing protein